MSEQEYFLDIPMCAYNHGKYIAQAIEGVIQQKTSFKFRLIIGEDCSTDNTRQIIENYRKENPLILKVYYHDKNIGPVENSKILFAEVKAKYIALCDGDDYWTDPYKLQKQVSFLEKYPDFSICFHNARILNEDYPETLSFSNRPDQKEISEFDDLAKGEFIYTPTCVFRTENFRKFPQKYYRFINNYTLDLHNAQYGKIKYLNEAMCVYRIHRGGIWSTVMREKTLMNQLPTYKFYPKYFDKKYRHYFIGHLRNMTSELITILLEKNDYKNFWRYYKDYVFYNITEMKKIKHIINLFLRANYSMVREIMKRNEEHF
jgi:glycosyltransferase involved in cell wall biosynthesis